MSKKKKHYLIYQTTNLVNGKIYIGKHITTDIEDEYFGSGNLIRAAINKYGLENFVKTILFELQNEEEMNLLEKCVVTQEFCDREDTYNINVGGNGGWGKYHHQILKHLGGATAIHLKRLSFTEQKAFKANVSFKVKLWYQQHPGYFAGNRNPMYGHVDSEETHKKRVLNHLGSKNSQYGKMWICNDLTKESVRIMKTDPIPEGWRKGRICKK